jgi:hypothetical protein
MGPDKQKTEKRNDTIAENAVTDSAKPTQTIPMSLELFKLSIDCH